MGSFFCPLASHGVHLDTATVAQIGNLLFRGLVIRSLPNAIRRNSRLPICATLGAYDFRWQYQDALELLG